MPSTNDIILQQYNSSGNWDEKLLSPSIEFEVFALDNTLSPIFRTLNISDISGLGSQLNNKQTLLESGTNIKTINGSSLLGSGNIVAGSLWATVVIPTVTLTFTQDVPDMVVSVPANARFTIRMTCEMVVPGGAGASGRLSFKPSQSLSCSYSYSTGGGFASGTIVNNTTEVFLSSAAGTGTYFRSITIQGKNNTLASNVQFRLTGTADLNNIVIDYMTY